jgi:hypothetical protein
MRLARKRFIPAANALSAAERYADLLIARTAICYRYPSCPTHCIGPQLRLAGPSLALPRPTR